MGLVDLLGRWVAPKMEVATRRRILHWTRRVLRFLSRLIHLALQRCDLPPWLRSIARFLARTARLGRPRKWIGSELRTRELTMRDAAKAASSSRHNKVQGIFNVSPWDIPGFDVHWNVAFDSMQQLDGGLQKDGLCHLFFSPRTYVLGAC